MKIIKTPKTLKSLILYTHTHTHTHTHVVSAKPENKIALSFPCVRRESTGWIFNNKNLHITRFRIKSGMTDCNESGRSMVEMLGTLAIIGVLSVVGLAMYKVAISKHRANTLLNEANKRAAIVAMQAAQGYFEYSIVEFENPSDYIFGVSKKNSQQFYITLSGNPSGNIDEDICQQMKGLIGTGTAIRNIDDNCTKITFNNDLSKTNIMTEDGPTGDDSSDCSGSVKLGTECQVCINGSYVDSDALCGDNSICKDGVCTSPFTGTGCVKNSDCEKESNCAGNLCFCNHTMNSCNATGPRMKASCMAKSTKLDLTVNLNGTQYLVSKGDNTNWFGLKNFCASYQKEMMSLPDLGCSFGTYCTNSESLYQQINNTVYEEKGYRVDRIFTATQVPDDSTKAYDIKAKNGYVFGGNVRYKVNSFNVFCK